VSEGLKYDLAKMLEEIEQDERGGKGQQKKVLSQEEIKAMARRRRRPQAAKPQQK
jgi:hypothetical protein